ncbi:HEAT repeat domain-containing protein [Sporosarcina beigongshangi]|uniref:HEAT repeat domain-containing protein n=1 Tax=Sporosarcina beigongshangi TaxID=2782538 RepID=UPI00193A6EED|nr:HEAT repeat domain-containing protein [Sporosarcina beigongshangi]
MGLIIKLLLLLIIVLVFILIFFTCYLIFERTREVSGVRKKEVYIREKQMLWYRYFRDAEKFHASLIPTNKFEIQAVEELFLSYLNNLFTPAILKKIELFSNQYLKQHFSGLLRSRKWSERINAMERIIDFRMDSLLEVCEKMDEKKLSHEEYFQLLKIYAVFKEEQFVNKLLNLPVLFSEYEYKKLLISVDEDILNDLMNRMEELSDTCQYVIIDILGIKRNMDNLSFLESRLGHSNDEIRIRSLKAIYELGVIIEPEKYVHFNVSPIWEERLMHARLLGNLPISYSLPYLEALLKDDSWWVRSQAAKTIGKDKQGAEILQSFIETASDQFAIDMANEVLWEGGSK